MGLLTKIFGDTNARFLRQYDPVIRRINDREAEVVKIDDEQIHQRFDNLRHQVGGEQNKLNEVLEEVFALTREAAKRAIGQRHYDVQLIGGIVLHQGRIAEMKTGEGKTLVATLPLALNALVSKGVHLITVNDYLARRDTGWMGSIYHRLGLSCAAIVHESAFLYDPAFADEQAADPLLKHLRPISRREAYLADITYGTNNEFGFDYLRDNMVPDLNHKVQRELFYAIVDEVDSILIDEARTPLIISAPVERSADDYRRVDGMVKQLLENRDFKLDEKLHSAFLTDQGISKLERLLNISNIYDSEHTNTLNIVNQALKANSRLFERDKQYVVRDGEVIIVDEFTGRLMFGRRYSEGLHQAIEAKEGVDVKQESQTLATITFQNLFRMYQKLAGMTGTAATEAEEFHKIYNLDVAVIPTHRPMIRIDQQDSVYKTEAGKFQAVVREIKRRFEQGQPVLAGTISIAKNEILSELLTRDGIPHQVLNAKNHEREAQTIAQAGRPGAVTIATNMAGRGVDIILGGNPPQPEEQQAVKNLGGLHVIGTERHESRRIDLQLRGRSGRQGDQGSSQFFISMEDDLMRIFGSDRMKNLMDRLGVPDDMPIENKLVSRSIESAQKKVEGHNFDIRKHLVEYDDVMNKHREVVYKRRYEVLVADPNQVREVFLGSVEQETNTLVSLHTGGDNPQAWDLVKLYDSFSSIASPVPSQRLTINQLSEGVANRSTAELRDKLIADLLKVAESSLDRLNQTVGDQSILTNLMRSMILRVIDTLWIEHLDLMEHLREGIGLRGYGQRDPLVEYKREAFRLFSELINAINMQIATSVLKIADMRTPAPTPMQSPTIIESAPVKTMDAETDRSTKSTNSKSAPSSFSQVGRNDPCPCGSGKKFKKCYLAHDPGCKLL